MMSLRVNDSASAVDDDLRRLMRDSTIKRLQCTYVHHQYHNTRCEVSLLESNVPFQHKYSYIRDKRSGVKSHPYPVKEGQRYINLNHGHLFVQQPPKKGKGPRGSFTLLR